MLYLLFFKTRLVPQWLSYWGIAGVLLSVAASVLLLFDKLQVIMPIYLILNGPPALFELALGFWLVFMGFREPLVTTKAQANR